MKDPRGISKDVFVKVEKYTFLLDFIVLEIEADWEIPFILGWPF